MNILMTDDEPLELDQLELLIRSMFPEWKICKAEDGIQALKAVDDFTPDLAFIDITLPAMSGIELAEKLKERFPKIDLIIITAHQNFSYCQKSLRLGALDYILKPVDQASLEQVLCRYRADAGKSRYSKLIMEAMNIIQSRYSEKINLVNVARHIHVNVAYLSRRFHQEVGVTFSEFLMSYRIERAKEFLKNDLNESIVMISEKCGFSGQQYFSTIFHRETGESPSEYRKRAR